MLFRSRLDWAALIDREKEMIKDIPENLARAMARRQVEVIRGEAAFAGPNTIRVGNRTLEARHIVIATGSKPRPLPIQGAQYMITSDEMLSERELPASVIFVGGGAEIPETQGDLARLEPVATKPPHSGANSSAVVVRGLDLTAYRTAKRTFARALALEP